MQITLTGNKISTTGNQLVADLTGDNVDDLRFGGTMIHTAIAGVYILEKGEARGGGWVSGYFGYQGRFAVHAVFVPGGAGTGRVADALTPQSISYLNAIRFTDSRINGGQQTTGWLQVNAFNTSSSNHTVELSRLIFDDASTTPPGFASIPGAQTEWGVSAVGGPYLSISAGKAMIDAAAVSAVPEPSSHLALLALGAGGLTLRRRLKRAA